MYGNCPETMYLLSIVHYLIVILVPTLLKHTHIYLHTHMHTTQAEQQAKQAETQEEQSPSSPSSQQQTNQTQRSVVGPMFISPPQHTHSHTPPPHTHTHTHPHTQSPQPLRTVVKIHAATGQKTTAGNVLTAVWQRPIDVKGEPAGRNETDTKEFHSSLQVRGTVVLPS